MRCALRAARCGAAAVCGVRSAECGVRRPHPRAAVPPPRPPLSTLLLPSGSGPQAGGCGGGGGEGARQEDLARLLEHPVMAPADAAAVEVQGRVRRTSRASLSTPPAVVPRQPCQSWVGHRSMGVWGGVWGESRCGIRTAITKLSSDHLRIARGAARSLISDSEGFACS